MRFVVDAEELDVEFDLLFLWSKGRTVGALWHGLEGFVSFQ